jgi:D-arabinose 1-dehydrogenase-like Zn-dependent alcohol dehydrogenase
MAKMRAVQVSRPGQLELVERDVPEPGPGTIRIKVEACGVCHSDAIVVDGGLPGLVYPRIPGHEVIGVVDKVGPGVTDFNPGRRVGVGWNGGYDGLCDACRRGEFFGCRLQAATGVTSDGGYAEYMVARVEAVARVPDGIVAVEDAPLMCAGLTTFNALRNSGARPGDLVGVIGVGGLGHLGIQFAARMGYETTAIGRGKDKEELARKLGARRYIDNAVADVASELTKLGGARAIVATAPSASSMADALGGLSLNGKLLVIGATPEPLQASTFMLLTRQLSIQGWYSGTSIDAEDTLGFALENGVKAMTELFPLDRAKEAYDRMMRGKVTFRAVLTMG